MDQRETLAAALVGQYVVDREIGRGGMAVVYLARDVKHDRLVALKILNPELGAIVGVERFLSEIRVTANLQHPNLLPLFDSGEASGQLYYVMPFVAGETLRAKLNREKQLAVDEAIHITIAIANALDYAHSHGVIHRDLKPENILLQHGEPIIADFGIALAISNAGGARVTQTGLSLGTPQYMSPEQAAGDRTIDGRSDIYSLSAILYEMLTGETPHVGNTVQAIIAKVLTEKPRGVRTLRASVPPHVERAIARGLAKLPADRFATARQFIDALQRPTADETLFDGVADSGTTPRHSWLRHPASVAALGGLALGAALVIWLATRRTPVGAQRVVRFTISIPAGNRVGSSFGPIASISPDGRRIAYLGPPLAGNEIWVRELDSDVAHTVPGTIDAYQPRFSPDGRWLVWFNTARLMWLKMPVDGGPVSPVIRVLSGTGIEWFTPDSIFYAPAALDAGAHILRTSINGGTTQRFLVDDSTASSIAQWNPILATDGRTAFFISRRRVSDTRNDELAFTTLDDRRIHTMGVQARGLIGFAAGRVIYVQDDGAVMTLPFDLRRHVILGPATATAENVQLDQFGVKASLSANGDLAYVSGVAASRGVIVGKGGAVTPLMKEEKQYAFPRYSPDGKRVVVAINSGTRVDVWVLTIASATLERLTSVGNNDRPEWTPDGRYVLFRSNRSGLASIWRQMADGSGVAEQITPPLPVPVQEAVMSPDGRTLLYRVDDPIQARDIYTMSLDGDKTPRPFVTTEFDELTPRFSPNGKWIAYVSNESGRDEVYLRPFPGPGGRALISIGGGEEPVWSRDGGRILYRSADAVVSASVSLTGSPAVAARDTIVSGPFLSNRFHPMYDVTPDGKHLLMLQGSGTRVLTVVLNWVDGLGTIVGAKK